MKVKCIDNHAYEGILTVGRTYDVRENADPEFFDFEGDAGQEASAFARRFTPVAVAAPSSWSPERGPQMASPKGRTIFKYQMPVLEQFELQLPQGAQIIRIQDQGGMFWLWAVVDLRKPNETRRFRAFKTGADIPDDFDTSKYVGFCAVHVQMELGLYIFEQE